MCRSSFLSAALFRDASLWKVSASALAWGVVVFFLGALLTAPVPAVLRSASTSQS